ncbi:ACP phosphodiesterase [Flavobacterium sp.]|uniref:acyl carrier protein phosphodiesterase n=1 Tax=Flavobacterium sp. TaxID=239 RepID=UPI00352955D9
MNFLAHIYLSGDNEMLKIGNFMADSIKGNNYLEYTGDLQKGILLHRAIDSFTDTNEIYRKSKHRLHKKYGHYSGIIMDVVYDHYLAKNWNRFSTENLSDFVLRFYQSISKNSSLLPVKTQRLVPFMIDQNWLESYVTLDGLQTILWQMSRRINYTIDMSEAISEVQEFYLEFESEFFEFMVEIEKMCKEKLKELG